MTPTILTKAKSPSNSQISMVQVASHLGGFLPGAEPKYLVPGSALHICGTYRAGERSSSDSSYDNGSSHSGRGHGHGHGHGQTSVNANAIPKDSVVDKCSRVWGQRDLYLGGCGVIPTQSACNPTLTAACFAIYAAEHLVQSLERSE
jgi:choline dehydrogenase-like flavoprotein